MVQSLPQHATDESILFENDSETFKIGFLPV
jgi:hypothetical protein